jgi:hypothetical protein
MAVEEVGYMMKAGRSINEASAIVEKYYKTKNTTEFKKLINSLKLLFTAYLACLNVTISAFDQKLFISLIYFSRNKSIFFSRH